MKPPSRPRPAPDRSAPQVPPRSRPRSVPPREQARGDQPAREPGSDTESVREQLREQSRERSGEQSREQSREQPRKPDASRGQKSASATLPAVPPPPGATGTQAKLTDVSTSGDLVGVQPHSGARSVVSTGLQARLAEKRSIEKARMRRRWYWIGGGIVVLAGIVWTVFFSPLLALDADRITIDGASQTVDESAVAELIEHEIGVPLPRLDTTSLRNEIKNVRGVRDVTLQRQWPSGLAVLIDARQPVAAVADTSAEGGFVLLDSEAVQVGRAKKVPKDLPVIDIPLRSDNADVLESVLVVLEAIPQSLNKQLESVKASTKDDMTLTLKSGKTVNWGDSSNNKLKAAVLEILLADEANAAVKIFDVSAPTAPITS